MQTSDRLRVLVLGYGEMGHALETLLAARHRVRIWQRHPPPGASPVDLEQVAPDSDFVLFCLPATAHVELATRLAPCLQTTKTTCLTIAKGLTDDGRLPAEVLTEICGQQRTVVLYGPMIAEEIRAGRPAFAECGTSNPALAEQVAMLFAGSALFVEPSEDIIGLSWSAILKNVYALAFGMADELALGDNVRGLLGVAALHELSQIVQSLGGASATPFHLAGLGDLITTATSAGSHHHELGRRLARGEAAGLAGEGLHTLKVLCGHQRFDNAQFPLYQVIDRCVRDPQVVRAQFSAWLLSPFKLPRPAC